MRRNRNAGLAAAGLLGAAILIVAILVSRDGNLPKLTLMTTQSPTSTGVEPRVVSVTPAGTDLLIGMGAADHLVGISNYDDPREGTAGKPKIGDYDNIDWEKISLLRPQILIVFYAADRIPTALQQKCDELGIRILNVKIETLDDIYSETQRVAEVIGETARAKVAIESLKAQLTAVAKRVEGEQPVKAIVVTGDDGLGLAGPRTFLDELLHIAGGDNAVRGNGPLYRQVDREMLRAMAPDVIIQLIPEGEKTPQVLTTAQKFWDSLPDIPAVRNHQVHVLTDWYSMQPGFHVGVLAEKFANILHPDILPSSRVSTRTEAQTRP